MIKDLFILSLFITGGYFGYQKFQAIQAEEAAQESNQPKARQGYSREQQIQQHIDEFENMKVRVQDSRSVLDKIEKQNAREPLNADLDPVFCKKAEREMDNLRQPKNFNDRRAVNKFYEKQQKIQQKINKYCGCTPACK
jgi:hypothetical protein